MEFIWNDGGRAACGYVGLAGDCVTRAIAIATGANYRDVYAALGDVALSSPRNGLAVDVSDHYLEQRGWQRTCGAGQLLNEQALPAGIVIVHVAREGEQRGHLCTVVDHVIHDTWNASEEEYNIVSYWTPSTSCNGAGLIAGKTGQAAGRAQELNQQAFEKILRRLRALDNTASNSGSTEGEKHNALRMMQDLMLRHNLSRDDIVDEDNVEGVQFTRAACPLNTRRACSWEVMLASYVTLEIFPTVQWYVSAKGHRTLFWFYGPRTDVQNCLALFQELLLTIAASAHLQYGGFVRGSGASYAEGYVSGLPRSSQAADAATGAANAPIAVSERSLIQSRTVALHQTALQWLHLECNIKLATNRRSGRGQFDPAATSRGKEHGASHKLEVPGRRKRLT